MSRNLDNVTVGNRAYQISPDDPPPLADRYWSVLRVQLIDELVGRPPRGATRIETDYAGLTPKVAADGLVGLVGRPFQLFPALNPLHPSAQSYDVPFTIRADGYLERTGRVTIPMTAGFPDLFAPTFIDLELHRQPIVILGRTVEAAGNLTSPIAGMNVSITGIWLTVPPGNVLPPPPDPAFMISLGSGLYLPRSTATGVARRRDLVPVAGQDKHLVENVAAGSALLELTDGVNLNPGDVIDVNAQNPDRSEFVTVQALAPSTTATAIASVTLVHPLANAHRRDAIVRRVLPQAPGVSNAFSRAAQERDSCVFLNSMTGLAAANTVEIAGAIGDPVEYHRIDRFITTSDADGYYRFPPLSRVAQLDIEAEDGGVHTTQTRTFILDYEQPENRVDFIF